MANVNLSQRDMDYIARVVATEVPASLQRTAPDQYKAMVEAVVDTITNRVASTGFPDTVEAVVNQDRQFSKIAGPSNLNPYGEVKNAPKASENLQKMVETHLVQRGNGKPSTVDNSVNYANPNYSTRNNLGWIADMLNMGGVTLGVGDAVHIHGNAPGAKVPDNYTLSVPGSIGNPSQMDSKNIGLSPSRNPGTPRMEAGFAQGRTFRNEDGSVFTLPQNGQAVRLAGQLAQYRPGTGSRQQNMARPVAPSVGGMPRNPFFPDRVIAPTQRPNVAPSTNPAEIARMQDNLRNQMAFRSPNPSNMNVSGYGFSTPARPSQAPNAGRGNINPPNVVSPPANVLSNFDQYGNFIGNRQSSVAPTSDFRSSLAERAAVPQRSISAPNQTAFAPGPTSLQSVRDAQSGLAKSNKRDQFARDILKGIPVEVAPAKPAGPSVSDLAKQYSAYGNRAAPAQNTSLYDMVDIPQSQAKPGQMSFAQQYASYGAGKVAPQTASTTTQAAPSTRSVQPQVTAPSVSVPGPVSAPTPQSITDAAKSRFDAAKPGVFQGIPPQDIYDQNAPGRSGFRGFGAGGFLGNLLTGNIGNMAGIERTGTLPGILGVIQNAVQGLGGPQQAAQAVQGAVPALGQAMGMAPAQQAAKAGNNMVIGRDAQGLLGWMADGGLSGGAANAGWMSNNPERNYGGYGGGYDPTPV